MLTLLALDRTALWRSRDDVVVVRRDSMRAPRTSDGRAARRTPRARAIVLVRARRRGGARRRDDRRRLDREFDRESSARTTRTRDRRARERD